MQQPRGAAPARAHRRCLLPRNRLSSCPCSARGLWGLCVRVCMLRRAGSREKGKHGIAAQRRPTEYGGSSGRMGSPRMRGGQRESGSVALVRAPRGADREARRGEGGWQAQVESATLAGRDGGRRHWQARDGPLGEGRPLSAAAFALLTVRAQSPHRMRAPRRWLAAAA